MKKLFSMAVLALMAVCLTACGGDDPRPEPTSRDAYITIAIPQTEEALKYINYELTIKCDNGETFIKTIPLTSSSAVTLDKIGSERLYAMMATQPVYPDTKYLIVQEVAKNIKNVVDMELKATSNPTETETPEKLTVYRGMGYEVAYSSGAVRINNNVMVVAGIAFATFKEHLDNGNYNESATAAAKL